MRCILTVNFSPWSRYSGGGQRSTHNLALALHARGHEVSVVYTKPPWERVALPSDLPYEVVWAALPALRSRSGAWLRPASPLFVARAVRRLLAREPAGRAIVHANGEEAGLVADLRRTQGPRFGFVVTPRYPALPRGLARTDRLTRLWLSIAQTKYVLLGRALRAADVVCPTSRHAAELVSSSYALAPERLHVVPNGISREFLRAAPALRAPSAGGSYAIYFGRLAREKGVHDLLEALAHSGPQPERFVFAGRGPELRSLQARAAQLGLAARVRFETWLDAPQLALLARDAQFAVLPSHEESFGNTMAEAMALGLPVISTRAGSIPELIQHGRTGILVAPSDVRGLAAAIRALAGDAAQRRALGEAAAKVARAEWTWDRSAERFEPLYAQSLQASATA
jgi:glycosyltransferase involved in cell wall biosynthesis